MMTLNVIKVGGAVVEDPQALSAFLDVFASGSGAKILVHGGGRTATKIAASLGLQTRMVAGRRVTDPKTLEVVTMVYAGLVAKSVVSGLQTRGHKSISLTGADLGCMISQKRPPVMTDEGEVDYGQVGDIRSVDGGAIAKLIDEGFVPVVSPLTFDPNEGLLNTNADSVASAVACAMAKIYDNVVLTYCFEKEGVLSDPDDPSSVIPTINSESFPKLVADGTVSGGMIPKLENAFAAISNGVAKVVITNACNLLGGTQIV